MRYRSDILDVLMLRNPELSKDTLVEQLDLGAATLRDRNQRKSAGFEVGVLTYDIQKPFILFVDYMNLLDERVVHEAE